MVDINIRALLIMSYGAIIYSHRIVLAAPQLLWLTPLQRETTYPYSKAGLPTFFYTLVDEIQGTGIQVGAA
jgi:short-subunit dehydrogenase